MIRIMSLGISFVKFTVVFTDFVSCGYFGHFFFFLCGLIIRDVDMDGYIVFAAAMILFVCLFYC